MRASLRPRNCDNTYALVFRPASNVCSERSLYVMISTTASNVRIDMSMPLGRINSSVRIHRTKVVLAHSTPIGSTSGVTWPHHPLPTPASISDGIKKQWLQSCTYALRVSLTA